MSLMNIINKRFVSLLLVLSGYLRRRKLPNGMKLFIFISYKGKKVNGPKEIFEKEKKIIFGTFEVEIEIE